jgi:N-methylhydantoinase A/oxoprolinase/acetone carboxylase beta subunit
MIIPSIPFDVTTLKFKKAELKLDLIPQWALERYNKMVEELEVAARAEMHAEGYKDKEFSLSYEILGRYGGQLWELRAAVPIGKIKTAEDFGKLLEVFENEYERTYSKEALAPRGGMEIVTVTVEATGPTAKPTLSKTPYVGKDAGKAKKGARDVYVGGIFVNAAVYSWDLLGNGNEINGPSIVESKDTTLFVPPDRKIHVDEYMNIHMSP